jgi:hypothetical protein
VTNSKTGAITEEYCLCGKSQSARRSDGSPYCAGCGKDYHPDNFEDYEPPEPDGEAFCGGEAEAALAESQDRIQRELKR